MGPTVAGYIIEERPFNSLDDLVNVKYISSGYLEDIINQGLACVDEETQEEVEKETPEEPEETEEENNEISEVIEDFKEESNIKKPITLDTISLNPKNPALHENEKLHENKTHLHGNRFRTNLIFKNPGIFKKM